MTTLNNQKLRCLTVLIVMLTVICIFSGCAVRDSSSNNLDAFLFCECKITAYAETDNGLVVTASNDGETFTFLVTDETVISRIPVAEKIESMEIGITVEVYSESWADDLDNVYFAKYINPSGNTDTKEESELLNSMAYSDATKMEKQDNGTILSCTAYSDAYTVNNLFESVGIELSEKQVDNDNWIYRITYYYDGNNPDEKEIVCLVYDDAIMIGNQLYTVELSGGMDAFFDYWEPIFEHYYTLYGASSN